MMAKNVKKGRGKTGRRVKDFQNGSAANDYDVAVDGEEAGEGHNSKHFEPNGKTLNEYLSLIDDEDAEIADIMDAARLKCQGPRGSITKATKRMVKDGYHAKELATLVRKHRTKRKLEQIGKNLDGDQRQHFISLEKALGDFADTPLGAAAIAEAAAESAVESYN